MTDQNNVAKACVRVERFSDLKFTPRFEYGHMAKVAQTCGEQDGSMLATGFARFKNAHIPWTIKYDEVLTVIEGDMQVHIGDDVYKLAERDSLWLPAGTELVYVSQQALVAYAIHPSNWHTA